MKEIISKIKAIIFGQNRASENLNQVPHSSPIIELSEEEKAILKLKLHEEENKRRQELKTELIEKYWNNVGESDTFGDYLKFMIKNLGNQFIEAPREEDQYKARRDEELLKKMTKNNSNKDSGANTSLRIKCLKDIETCFYMMTSAYGEDKETEKIYKICVEYLKKTKEENDRIIDFVELSNFNGNLVVAIYGSWDNSKGIRLPWQELPRSDCWVNAGGSDTYKSTYLMNSHVIKASTI